MPPELVPPAEPVALGDEVPEEVLGPQSFIAVVLLLLPAPLGSFEAELLLESFEAEPLALGLLVEPVLALGLLLPELEPVLFEAVLPGGQSVLFADMPPEVEPLVPDLSLLVLDLSLAPAPVVVLVCAIAAVPRLKAMIDAAVRRRRFIRYPPLNEAPRQAESRPGRCFR